MFVTGWVENIVREGKNAGFSSTIPLFLKTRLSSVPKIPKKILIFFSLTKIPKQMKNPKGIPKNAQIISHLFLSFLVHLRTTCSE